MTAQISTLMKLDAKACERIEVKGDHWVWKGTAQNGNPTFNGQSMKPRIWRNITGEVLRPSELVIRDCDEPLCVNPDHQIIGDRSASTRRLRERLRA